MSSYDATVALDRKLTPEETRELKISLMPYFHATGDNEASPEDINDLLDYAFAMVNNQKSVEYVIQELVGMEMEFCNAAVAEKVGGELSSFLKKVKGEVDESEKGGKIASLKSTSSEKGNALTMSGALGASREGGRNKNNNKEGNKTDKKRDNSDRRGDRNNNRRGNNNNNERGNNRGRSSHKEAFDRLAGGNNRRGRGNRRDEDRGGRGRGDRRDGRGRDGGRGGRGGRGDRGNRRSRDEYEEPAADQDFVPMGRGGRGRGGRDGPSKRPRYDENEGYDGGYYDEGYGYDDGYGYGGYHGYGGRGGYFRGGRGRGRYGGRGRGRGRGGRGRGGPPTEGGTAAEHGEAPKQEGATASTPDAAHPSPLVQASYSGGRYGGRGRFGRGRGGRGRGGGRAHVVSMIQSKTWVRKKPEDAAAPAVDANPPAE